MERLKQLLAASAVPAAVWVVGVLVLEYFFPGSVGRFVSLPWCVFGGVGFATLGFYFEKQKTKQ
jgi:hypothetical protein